MRVVIMVGGRGERLRPLTDTCPKPLLPVAGRPVLDRLLETLAEAGLTDVTLATGYLHEMIEDYVLDGARWGVRVGYVHQSEPMGTAGALSLLPDKSEPVLVVNGDKVFERSRGFKDLAGKHVPGETLVIIGTKQHRYQVPAGVVNLTREKIWGRESHRPIREKPVVTWCVVAGVYVLSPIMIRAINQDLIDMPDLIVQAAPHSVRAQNFAGYVLDIGNPTSYKAACARLS